MNNLPAILFLMTTVLIGSIGTAQDSVWKRTDSDDPYLHRIPLRDSRGEVIDPAANSGNLPHLGKSCAPCHDVESASGGLHAGQGPDGRAGEPWILVDPRSATRMPLHRRKWPGLLAPPSMDLDQQKWSQEFGRHETGAGDDSDCLVCHLTSGYDFAKRIEQIDRGNTALAPFVAAGLVDTSGQLDPRRFDSTAQVELNLLGDAGSQACLRCHTVRDLDEPNDRRWHHQDDVHLAAGLSCVDCHRSGIDHHMVRGYEGEVHPSGTDVTTLSCRGCHLDEDGGLFGAPLAEHRGLPPFHLEEISCTACHAGPGPGRSHVAQWTSRAHRLGEASQERLGGIPPRIIGGFRQRDDQQRISPVRLTWPDGWGVLEANGAITLLTPAQLRPLLRRALRVRSDLVKELSGQVEGRNASSVLVKALKKLQEPLEDGREAILITGGRLWKVNDSDELQATASPAAEAVSWALSHPVRPARAALGAGGCNDCHSSTSSWLKDKVGPSSLLPLPGPGGIEGPSSPMESGIIDSSRWKIWSWLFLGRDAGKIYFSICALLAISGGLLGLWKMIQEESR